MIELARVYKSYDDPVLCGVTLRVERAQLVGLVGPPACGKSLLLRAIAGLVEIDAGSIILGGVQMVGAEAETKRRVQRDIGMLFQNVALFDSLTVFENVAFPLRRFTQTRESELRCQVEKELSAVGLSGTANRLPHQLSGGQRRRVGLARAAVGAPRMLLCDEPAAGLDPVTTSRTFALLKDMQRRLGAAIVVISSDIDRLLPICDEVAMMHRGRILFQGSPAALRAASHPVVHEFLTGDTLGVV